MWSALSSVGLGGGVAGIRSRCQGQLGRAIDASTRLGVPGAGAGSGVGGVGGGAYRLGGVGNSAAAIWTATGQVRNFYFPRKNWHPWRVRLVHQRQAACRQKRHLWPRYKDAEEAQIFGEKEDGTQLMFREKEIRLSLKRMTEYAKLMRGRQLQDSIDWVESVGRLRSAPLLKLMRKAQQEVAERHNWDLARTYLFDAQPHRGYLVKSVRRHSRGRYGINKSPRNYFMIRVRQMPLEEFFHRIYVYNKVPRSLASDMRLALHESRVSQQMIKEWAPYLSAESRLRHRKEIKWLDSTRQWDYFQVRQEWIQAYKANLLRSSSEAREARGLPPLAMVE